MKSDGLEILPLRSVRFRDGEYDNGERCIIELRARQEDRDHWLEGYRTVGLEV